MEAMLMFAAFVSIICALCAFALCRDDGPDGFSTT